MKYIELNTAKLAKGLGFQYEVKRYYVEYLKTHRSDNPAFRTKKGDVEMESHYFVNSDGMSDLSNENYTCYAAPVQTHLQDWLRTEYNIHIIVHPNTINGQTFTYSWSLYPIYLFSPTNYLTYEEALESVLVESLKLIKSHNLVKK